MWKYAKIYPEKTEWYAVNYETMNPNMTARHFLLIISLSIVSIVHAGFDIRTSSVIEYPGVEVLGYYNGAWYAIGFELPGNLNKPPKFQIFKHTAGFKSGKTSVTYNSFGEKTFYLRAAFINNKISLFYAVCEKRVDEEFMIEKREGHKLLPVIMRQDFDPVTLESAGEPVMMFDEKDEYFTCSGIDVVESADRSKVAVLFKPYYKQYRYKAVIMNNKTSEVYQRTYDFKWRKEYLRFMETKLSNDGQLYISCKVRSDVLSLNTPPKNKPQNVYFFFSHSINGDTAAYKLTSPVNNNQFLGEPLIEIAGSEGMIAAFDFYGDTKWKAYQGTAIYRFEKELANPARRDVLPDQKFAANATAYHPFKKGSEFTNLTTRQVLPMQQNGFLVLTEYLDTLPAEKNALPAMEYGYIMATLLDANLQMKGQYFIPKKQISNTVDYAFSARAYASPTGAHIFFNADWEADGENNMNVMCFKIAPDGTASGPHKVLNTSGEFYTRLWDIYPGANNNVMFREEKLVDYGDITRHVKLLEITIR